MEEPVKMIQLTDYLSEMNPEEAILFNWLVNEHGLSHEDVSLGLERFRYYDCSWYSNSWHSPVKKIPLIDHDEIDEAAHRSYFPGTTLLYEWTFDRDSEVTLSDTAIPEDRMRWLKDHAEWFDPDHDLTRSEKTEILLHLVSHPKEQIRGADEAQIAAMMFYLLHLAGYGFSIVLELFNLNRVDILISADMEPAGFTFLLDDPIPKTPSAQADYKAGLENRVLTWKQAAPILDLNPLLKVSLPPVRSILKKLDAAEKMAAEESAIPKSVTPVNGEQDS